MPEMSGAQALVRQLRSEGVDTIFALPGVQIMAAFDALHEAQNDIKLVHVRHEQATTYMADGYAKATGRVGVAMAVPGPGALNASAGLQQLMQVSNFSHQFGRGYTDMPDLFLIDWYYSDAVYAPLYYGYGGPGQYAERRLIARSFDAEAMEYGSMFELGIVDPAKVTRSALENAASVAGMVLTTESLITELNPMKLPAPFND